MNLEKLEEVQNRLHSQDLMITKLKGLRQTARRTNQDWENCINVAFDKGDPIEWEITLNLLAGKLVHENKKALEMCICNVDGHDVVFVRTA